MARVSINIEVDGIDTDVECVVDAHGVQSAVIDDGGPRDGEEVTLDACAAQLAIMTAAEDEAERAWDTMTPYEARRMRLSGGLS